MTSESTGWPRDLLVASPASIVVLSPHLDDAALSCGAAIADDVRTGARVTVVTVFTGLPHRPLSKAARAFHRRCGHGDDAMTHREAEDVRALARLGPYSIRLGVPEALYRCHGDGRHRYPDGSAIFATNHSEPNLVAEVARRLSAVDAVRTADVVLAPLGVGDHVDHRIVAEAAVRLGRQVAWYEDVPYVTYPRCQDWQDRFGVAEPILRPVDPPQWQAKLDAVVCYASQQAVLWPGAAEGARVLTEYALAVGGTAPAERFWRVRI